MKKHILFLAVAIFSLNACQEIPPKVTGATGGSSGENPVTDQKRQVLIEEFTGVRCVQCPGGAALIQDLLAGNGEQLIAVSIHAGDFTTPYPESVYDFRTPEGEALISYLDEPFGFPSAVVNRKLYSGQFDLQLGQGDWAGYIASEKEIPPKVRINIEPTFNAATRAMTAKVTLYVDEAITDPDVRISIMITENDIKDLQITPGSSTPVPDYTHRHVMRKMLTNYSGDPITEPMTLGAEIKKTFNATLPAGYKEENCEVVALVSLAGTSKEVLQAHQVHLIK
jgi:hypothetical protein